MILRRFSLSLQMLSCLLYLSVSPSSRFKIDCSCRFGNAFCDVFNTDLSHHIFQASHNDSSKTTIIAFCLWPPSFQNSFAAASVLPQLFFLWQSRYESTTANDRSSLGAAVSCHRAPCFPVDENCNVIDNLPLLKLRLILLPEVQLIHLCSCRLPSFLRKCL